MSIKQQIKFKDAIDFEQDQQDAMRELIIFSPLQIKFKD
jgi:hypothetical protein